MPADFEMDVSAIVAWADDLVDRRGVKRAQRIALCDRYHYPGISCVCGWLDDPPMPMPELVET